MGYLGGLFLVLLGHFAAFGSTRGRFFDALRAILGQFNPLAAVHVSSFLPPLDPGGGAVVTIGGVPESREGPQELLAGVADEALL